MTTTETEQEKYEKLEQLDYIDGDYLEKVAGRYTPLIGLFLVNFSILEHELDLLIAEFIVEDAHEPGFIFIEKLKTWDKIDLFYKLYARLESTREDREKINRKLLNQIRSQLESLNRFRNNIVHANWQSLTKGGFVRTKMVVDEQEGYVKFRKVQITPKIVRQRTKDIKKLIDQINKYNETFWD